MRGRTGVGLLSIINGTYAELESNPAICFVVC